MAPYQYENVDRSRVTNSIADLMLRGGDVRARALQQSGELQARGAEAKGMAFANTLGTLGQMAAAVPGQRLAMQRQDQLAQEHALKLQDAQAERAKAQREIAEEGQLRQLFGSGTPPPPEAVYKVIGPQRGAVLLKGMAALHTENQRGYDSTQTLVRDVMDGLNAAPEPMRAGLYPAARERLLTAKLITPEDMPEQYDAQAFTAMVSYGRQPKDSAPKITQTNPEYDTYENGVLTKAGVPKVAKEANATEAQLAVMAARGGVEGAQATRALEIMRAQHPKTPAAPKAGTDSAGLVAAVLANPSLFDQLTPTERGKVAPALNEQGFDFGKPLPPAAIKAITESKSAIDGLKDLRQVVKDNEQYMGPIAGLSAMNPYSDARKAQAKIDFVRQRVGKALEGGVLRKEDEAKYKIMLAEMRDTPELALSKLDYIITNIERDITNYTNELRLGGRRVATDTAGRATPTVSGEAKAAPGAPIKVGGFTVKVKG